MKTLGAILKIFLWIFLLAAALAGLTLLAWWMRWPMFTGVFVVLGLAAGALLFFALRFCWRLRNKRRFIEQALSGLQGTQSASVAESPLETLWNGLLMHDRQSHGRAVDPRDFLERAWYVVLDATGSLSPVFAENPSLLDAASPIARHDFGATTLLQVQEAALNGGDKEDLLTLMARDVKKGALRGLVLLLSFDELKADDQNLHERGYLLRTRLYELTAALNRSLPLYVLVENVDRLPGGQLLFARPGAENWGGRFFPEEAEEAERERPGRTAAQAATASLRGCFYDDLVAHRPTSGDEFICFERLEALGDRLDQLFISLLQEAPRHDPLRLSGVFFCPTGKAVAARTGAASSPADAPHGGGQSSGKPQGSLPHVVLTRFFAQTLPASGGLSRALKGRFAAYSTGWLTGMSAWFLFLLAICGLLAADTLYQKRALSTAPPALSAAMAALKLAPMQQQMRYILQLEEAQKRWLLPSFGLDAIGDAAREEKREFTRRLYGDVLPPLVEKLRKILEATAAKGYQEEQHAALMQLSWLSHAVNERIRKGKTAGASVFFPLTEDDGWNTVGSDLIRAGLNWTDNPDQLRLLSSELAGVITRFIADYFPVFSKSVIDYYNNTNTDQQICLSQYWPHLAEQGGEDFCIPAYYTAASYAVHTEFFNGFRVDPENSAAGRTGAASTSSPLERFLPERADSTNILIRRTIDDYYRQYAEYWLRFAQKFSEVSANVQDETAYEPFFAIKNLRDTPHLKLLERMNHELAPLKNANPRPAWFAEAELFEVMYAVAMEGHGEANPAAWHTLLMAGTRMPDVLQTLWQEADNREHMREIYDGIMAMTLYLGSVREMLHDLSNRNLSLAFARVNFSGKEQDDVKQRPYTDAKRYLATVLARFSQRDLSAAMPQAQVFSSLLDFAGNGIVLEAALALQKDWENKVLSNPIYRFSRGNTEKMYGKEGIVSLFAQTDLLPFLERRIDGTVAAIWDGHEFPFTDDFLYFIGISEEWAARFHAAPETEHSVRMRSSPLLVNVDARSKPNGYTLSLACQDKNWQIVNRNYPHDEYFVYNQSICGQVTLRVDFPDFSLERKWPDFLLFVRDFLFGEKDFTPEDFPESAGLLEKAGVKSLHIPLLPDGAARLLRDESANAPVVPERITYVRE
jgi:hypothetical protein